MLQSFWVNLQAAAAPGESQACSKPVCYGAVSTCCLESQDFQYKLCSPSPFFGDSQLESALPLLGAEIGGHTTSLSEQTLRARVLLRRAELARRWLLSWPGCQFLGGTIFGRFFLSLLFITSPSGK